MNENHKRNIQPKLSIIILTYNFQDYIAQALDSVLMQQMNFDYELLIFDDVSTDRTREILLDYKKKHSSIHLFFAKKNIGFNAAMIFSTAKIKGDYFIILDGDDYYTDETKLQRQINFLDANPDYVGCVHNIEIFSEHDKTRSLLVEDNSIKKAHIMARGGITTDGLAIGRHYVQTSSHMWRKVTEEAFSRKIYGNIGDWSILLLYSQYGKIHYDDRVMSCYRITGKGDWTTRSQYKKHLANMIFAYYCNRLFTYSHNKAFMKNILGMVILAIRDMPSLKILPLIMCGLFAFLALGKLIIHKSLTLKTLRRMVLKHWLKHGLPLSLKEKIICNAFRFLFAVWQLLIWVKIYSLVMRFFMLLFNIFYLLPKTRNIKYWKFRWYQFWNINIYKEIE